MESLVGLSLSPSETVRDRLDPKLRLALGDPAVISPVAGSTRLTVLVVATLEFSDSEVKTSSVLSCSCLDSRRSWRPWLSSLSLLAPGRHRAESEEQLENWNTAELSELSGCALCTVHCIVSDVFTLNTTMPLYQCIMQWYSR